MVNRQTLGSTLYKIHTFLSHVKFRNIFLNINLEYQELYAIFGSCFHEYIAEFLR
jgi:hypothetical protein